MTTIGDSVTLGGSGGGGADPAVVADNTARILANEAGLINSVAERIANDTDIANNIIAINQRVRFQDSLTIQVPADAATIQDALDLAGEYYSKSGLISILLADGDHTVNAELKCRHANRIQISAASGTLDPLTSADYSGTKASDKTLTENHHAVRILNTGSANFLGGSDFDRIDFYNIAFMCRDSDTYVFLTNDRSTLRMFNCTIFGGTHGVNISDKSFGYFVNCTFVHQSYRSFYTWNGSSALFSACEFLYTQTAGFCDLDCSAYLIRCNADVTVTGVSSQRGSSIYLRGGTWDCGARCFYNKDNSLTILAINASTPLVCRTPQVGWAFNNSSLIVSGSDSAGIDVSGVTGAYLFRALRGSHLEISAALNPSGKACRIDQSSNGAVGGFTGIVSPTTGVVGNSNSLWS